MEEKENDDREEREEEEQFTSETIVKLLEERNYRQLKEKLCALESADIALLISELDMVSLVVTFRILPKEIAAEVFVEMETEEQQALLSSFSDRELTDVIGLLFADDTVDIIEEMPANVVHRVLALVSAEKRRTINELLKYPEDSTGSVMTVEFVSLRYEMTVSDALEHIRKTAEKKETVYTCYVTDDRRCLIGYIDAVTLMVSPSNAKIGDIMESEVIFAETTDNKEDTAAQIQKYDLLALPVVDRENRLVGIVTVDDAMDVIEDAATEDMEIMAAMIPSDKTYLHSTPFDLFRHRIPWLMLLMVSATFTGMIITGFEEALAAQVALTAFIPMLMDTGGNSGSQSSVTIIRALSLDELDFSDIWSALTKEIGAALLCGVSLSAVCFGKIMLIDRLLMNNPNVTVTVALTVCLTMAVTVLIAKIVGCVLPLCAKKLGFDPAVMASPFITTIVDALSLLVYFGVAHLLLFS